MSKPARCDGLQNQLQQVRNVPAVRGGPTRIKQLHGFEMYSGAQRVFSSTTRLVRVAKSSELLSGKRQLQREEGKIDASWRTLLHLTLDKASSRGFNKGRKIPEFDGRLVLSLVKSPDETRQAG